MTAVPDSSVSGTIRRLERAAWDALCDSGAKLVPLLAKDAIMIFPGGLTLTASSSPTLHDVLYGPDFNPWNTYGISDDAVIPLGRDGAFIYYKVEATRGEQTFRALCSSTWVLEDNEQSEATAWKMVSHQQTLI